MVQRDRSEQVLELQAEVLESIALGQPLVTTLDLLCSLVEGTVPGGICSVMVLDDVTGTLSVAAAPAGTPALIDSLNGLVPGDLAGSCGTAVHQGRMVVVEDTGTDPRWAELKSVADRFGIKSCWSVPIRSSHGHTWGSFAISQTRVCTPGELERRTLESAAHLAGIAMDREYSDNALRESEQRYQDLFENAPDMFLSVEAGSGKILACNETMARTLGSAKSKILGRAVSSLYDPTTSDRAAAAFREFCDKGLVTAEDLKVQRADGTTIDVSLKATADRDEGGRVIRGRWVWRDVTSHKRVEEAVRQSQKLESLGVLASGIAHDFNNLLVGILGNAQMAMEETGEGSPVFPFLREIEQAGTHAANLTRQLLVYSGGGMAKSELIDLGALVGEMSGLLRSGIAKEIPIRHELDTDLMPMRGDSTQIRQIVMNLLTNAAEAARDGGGAVVARAGTVEVEAEFLATCVNGQNLPPGAYSFIEVEDQGPGMDAATRERIFDPFFTTKSHGRGLGLAATLGILKAHRGALLVDSVPGRGTKMRLLCPAQTEAAPSEPTKTVSLSQARGATVLVVDDEEPVVRVLATMLRRSGMKVLTAMTGEHALDLARRNLEELDLAVLDLAMPGMSGADLSDGLRGLRRDLPIVFCSGQHAADVSGELEDQPHTRFVTKPFDSHGLQVAIEEAMA